MLYGDSILLFAVYVPSNAHITKLTLVHRIKIVSLVNLNIALRFKEKNILKGLTYTFCQLFSKNEIILD